MTKIAFLSFDWDYRIISEYYLGLQERLKGQGDVQVVIFNAFGRYYSSLRPKESSFKILSLCDLDSFDGFLIQGNRSWPPALRQQVVDEAVALGKPVVSINYDLAGAHTVGTNNYQEEFDLVSRVVSDHGCKKAAFVNGLKTSAEAQARMQGFIEACEKLGIQDARLYQANWQKEAGVATAKKLLRKPHDLPDVVFCCNDDLAVGLQETLQEAGVRVPEDVMVAGFDNRESELGATPHITTIDRDYQNIAVTALDTILSLLEGKEVPAGVSSHARHILAESCGYASPAAQDNLDGSHEALNGFYEALRDFQLGVLDADSVYAVMECCELVLHMLGCNNVLVSLNDAYLHSATPMDANAYGLISHLMARSSTAVTLPCDREHIYASFATTELLPSEIAFDAPLYVVSPLRHNEACIGMLVTEGVSPVMRHGLLALFLGMLSAAIEIERKNELLRAFSAHLSELPAHD